MNVLEARRRMLGAGVYKKTVIGNPAIAQGSLARRYPSITMQGWTEQAQYEGKNLFDAAKAKQLDSWIDTGVYRHFDIQLKPNTTYTLFVSQNNMYKGYKEEYDGNFAFYLGENENTAVSNILFGNTSAMYTQSLSSYTFTTTEVPYYINLYVSPWSEENLQIAFDELLVDMMLVEGSSVVPYEPYTGGAPSPSPDYPQEIVSAGNWNEETQKWEYEIEVGGNDGSSQTVLLTSDRPLTKWDRLEKRGGQWGWVYKSVEIVLDGSEDEHWSEYATNDGYYIAISTSVYNDFSVEGYAFSDKFLFVNTFSYEHPSIISPSKYYYFLNVKRYGETVSDWRTYLQTNPVTILYETELETFVPLSASEQEQMNELYTNRPTTVLSNDAGCEMALTYKTKKSLEVTA